MTAAALRRRHLSRQVHALGARAFYELLTELGTVHGIEADILARLERYGRLDPDIVAAVGADRLFPERLVALAGGRR